ncbi:hypothetical protein RRG08_009176 [Elysia crispata]|uniref:Uncharacterized protein n=1 Tax=Elysia crispata TaxID=231223 RepID=A0AAE0ZP79_9GAST|nr:hypothetical protein RRG08_009176 [Elysia crispata]
MTNWDKNHVGAKRVVRMNQSQDKHNMTGIYSTLNLALVKYSGNGAVKRTSNLMSDIDNRRENSSAILNSYTDCEIRQNCKLNQEGQSCDMNKLEFGAPSTIWIWSTSNRQKSFLQQS